MEIQREIRGYYDQGLEHGRLTTGASLELIRTQHLLTRLLPPPPARILDVGGGSGVYAKWLMNQGHEVDLIDPVPLHVDQATALGVRARAGDAGTWTNPTDPSTPFFCWDRSTTWSSARTGFGPSRKPAAWCARAGR